MNILAQYTFPAEKMHSAGGDSEKSVMDGVPVWIFPKRPAACSVAVESPAPPAGSTAAKITLRLLSQGNSKGTVLFSSELRQTEKIIRTAPVRSFVSETGAFSSVTLESCLLLDPEKPFQLTVTRRTGDGADTASDAMGLAEVKVEFFRVDDTASCVEDSPGYNSWPMCQTLGEKIVCTYSRGSEHNNFEPHRAVYARVSSDGGCSWEEEHLVCNTPQRGDVTIGKGLDEQGNMLLLVRHAGDDGFRHRLYRSADGKNFECVCDMDLPRDVIQITDIFHVPGVGMMALFFAGSYGPENNKYWGKLESSDNGSSWRFTVIEKELSKLQWPTEPSAVYLGEGKILVVARTESHEDSSRTAQFQIISTDHGRTWHKELTNITDVNISTPSLILDPDSGLVSCYYFYRGRGLLNRRTAEAEKIFNAPLLWPAPETVAAGSCEVCEAGNVNAVRLGSRHVLAYYSGAMPDTAIFVKTLSAPEK